MNYVVGFLAFCFPLLYAIIEIIYAINFLENVSKIFTQNTKVKQRERKMKDNNSMILLLLLLLLLAAVLAFRWELHIPTLVSKKEKKESQCAVYTKKKYTADIKYHNF